MDMVMTIGIVLARVIVIDRSSHGDSNSNINSDIDSNRKSNSDTNRDGNGDSDSYRRTIMSVKRPAMGSVKRPTTRSIIKLYSGGGILCFFACGNSAVLFFACFVPACGRTCCVFMRNLQGVLRQVSL